MNPWVSRSLGFAFGFGLSISAVIVSDALSHRQDALLGSLDFTAYCQQEYGSGSVAVLTRTDTTGWRCATRANGLFNTVDLDPSSACDALFDGRAFAKAYDVSRPYSWQCFRGQQR